MIAAIQVRSLPYNLRALGAVQEEVGLRDLAAALPLVEALLREPPWAEDLACLAPYRPRSQA